MTVTKAISTHRCITREAYCQAIEDMRNPNITPGRKTEMIKKFEKKAGKCPTCEKRIGSLRFWNATASYNH